MIPLITLASFVGSAFGTKALLDRVSPTPTPQSLREYEDVGYTDADGVWHSLLPKTGHWDSDGTWVYEEE